MTRASSPTRKPNKKKRRVTSTSASPPSLTRELTTEVTSLPVALPPPPGKLVREFTSPVETSYSDSDLSLIFNEDSKEDEETIDPPEGIAALKAWEEVDFDDIVDSKVGTWIIYTRTKSWVSSGTYQHLKEVAAKTNRRVQDVIKEHASRKKTICVLKSVDPDSKFVEVETTPREGSEPFTWTIPINWSGKPKFYLRTNRFN